MIKRRLSEISYRNVHDHCTTTSNFAEATLLREEDHLRELSLFLRRVCRRRTRQTAPRRVSAL